MMNRSCCRSQAPSDNKNGAPALSRAATFIGPLRAGDQAGSLKTALKFLPQASIISLSGGANGGLGAKTMKRPFGLRHRREA